LKNFLTFLFILYKSNLSEKKLKKFFFFFNNFFI
jgi:hypothetical protein